MDTSSSDILMRHSLTCAAQWTFQKSESDVSMDRSMGFLTHRYVVRVEPAMSSRYLPRSDDTLKALEKKIVHVPIPRSKL